MIDCKKFGFGKYDEVERNRGAKLVPLINTPKPVVKLKLVYQSFNQSVEEVYFWLLSSLRDDWGMYDVKKVTDIFTASEQSAFWGQAQQRLSIQQGQISNYLATIGKLVKELFQIVREIRILDERLDLYNASYKAIESESDVSGRKMSQAAEIALRGYWVDLKDGGVKSPGSVYGLASTLGYAALPDIFFAAPPMKKDEIDKYVDSLNFNTKLKDVLRRKMKGYLVWKEYTFNEMKTRRNFTIKFLRQHYDAIQMYINWVKPYLRNVKRLSQNFERSESEDLIGAFEGSFTEIEIVCSRKQKAKHHHSVVVLNLLFRTQPHMDFHQEGYQQKGPVHVGRSEFILRGYAWSDEDMGNYIKLRDAETLEIIGDIDSSLKEAIDALGDDLRKYLKEAGEKFPEDVAKEKEDEKEEQNRIKEMKGVIDPFVSVFSGFKEIFLAFFPKKSGKKNEPSKFELDNDRKKAEDDFKAALWNTYKNFKKAHRMETW